MGFTLIDSGNVALVLSMLALFVPAAVWPHGPWAHCGGGAGSPTFSLLMGSLFLLLAFLAPRQLPTWR